MNASMKNIQFAAYILSFPSYIKLMTYYTYTSGLKLKAVYPNKFKIKSLVSDSVSLDLKDKDGEGEKRWILVPVREDAACLIQKVSVLNLCLHLFSK
jgi:hypothetical protein